MDWLRRGKDGRPETEGPHAAVRRADPYAFSVAHRRLAWMLRLSVGLNIALAVAVVSAVNAIATLVPLKTTEIALLRTDPRDDRLYRVEPISPSVEGFGLLMESMARRYVRMLLEIDTITQTERFRSAFAMTDKAFYERFRGEWIDTKKVQDFLANGMTRTIHVESVDRVAAFGGTWKYAVDFIQRDRKGAQLIGERNNRAYLNMDLRPHSVREEDKYENPLGITVIDLVLKEKGKP